MNAARSAPVAWCETPKSTASPRKYAASQPSATPPETKKSGATTRSLRVKVAASVASAAARHEDEVALS